MHFSIPLLAAGYNSKWVPIRFSSIFEIAGLIGKVLAPKVRLPADEGSSRLRLPCLSAEEANES